MQKIWGEKPYRSLDWQLKTQFGEKVYKLALNGGMSCPNRDGRWAGADAFSAVKVEAEILQPMVICR